MIGRGKKRAPLFLVYQQANMSQTYVNEATELKHNIVK